LVVSAGVGCDSPAPIRQYTINTDVPESLKGSDRMLAAILSGGSDAWFFKVVGPADAVESVEGEIRTFIGAVRFDDGKPKLDELPTGWVRDGEKPMRFATLLINTPAKELELSISQLPKSGDWDEQVAMNVNRWRGQLGLAESDARWAGAEPLELAEPTDQAAVWVDLSGKMSAGPSMAPFAGGMPGGMPPAAAPGGRAAGDTPSATPAVADTAAGDNPGGLKYDAPEDWRAGKMSMMRMAAFNIGPEDQVAELTIIQAGGDLRGNVDRWIGQVRGDAPPAEVVDAALAAAEELEVSGLKAQRFYLSDGKAESPDAQAIDATIVPLEGGMSLFVKATGPASTLKDQREAIGKFLQSLKLPE
jgi:hypothetical protein